MSGKIVETSRAEMNNLHTKFSTNQCKEKWFAILHWKIHPETELFCPRYPVILYSLPGSHNLFGQHEQQQL